jgi:molybdopterin/thiamine biosynthesis adenylyltransferase
MDYFHRQIELWGEKTQDSLKDKKVAIIGCGGLGCSNAIALGSSGIGTIYLVDFDTVAIHNIHRQIGFKMGDEDLNKADVLAKLVKSRYGEVEIYTFIEGIYEFSQRDIDIDLIIDCTDNLPARDKIDKFAKKLNLDWIYGSVEEFLGQVCIFHKANFDEVFKVEKKKPAGIAAPMVMHIASLQANLAIKYLIGDYLKKDYLYYLSFEDGELMTQKFRLPH